MNKRKDTVRQGVIKGLELAIILLFLSIILGMVIVILTVIPSDFRLIKALVSDRLLLAVNIWPIFCVMFLLYFLCNSIGGSFVGTGLLFMVVAEVNRFKITFRDDPFVFADVLLAAEAKEMTKKYQLFLDKATFCAIIILVLVAVGSFWLLKIKIKHISSRVIGIVSVVAIFGMLYSPIYFNSAIYDGMWHAEFGNIWKESNQYMSRGLVYSFLRSIPNAVNVPPEGYLEKESEEKLDNYQTVELAENKKVNVISIMLEAYNDFSKFEQIEFAENPYKTFHEIQENSYSGKLYTDIFAGGTIQTERSFLTGYSGQIKSKKNTESFVRYFKSQGYYTEAMHPGFGWFYDRKNIDEYLGFDSFVCYENKFQQAAEKLSAEERYGSFLKDIDFFDYIIKGYEEAKKKKQNYFHFSVTYQNHTLSIWKTRDGNRVSCEKSELSR